MAPALTFAESLLRLGPRWQQPLEKRLHVGGGAPPADGLGAARLIDVVREERRRRRLAERRGQCILLNVSKP